MEAFLVGIIVGAVLMYFYNERKQPKQNHNDATGIPVNPRKEEGIDLANQGQNRNPGDSPKGPRP